MKKAIAYITGVSPLSQSRYHDTPKLNKELAKDYEKRTWKNRLHVTEDGYVKIPAMAFKNCMAEIAKFLSLQIPGRGKQTYTKHFESGVLVVEDIPLPIHQDNVIENWVHVPSDGVRGGKKRVMKCYPLIPSGWQGVVEFIIVDDTITEEVFLHHLKQAGQLIGIGTFRVRNCGTFGRFKVEKMEWEEYGEAIA
ncbi:MAG: hypothetical protein F6K31_11800 [Symploca sp. SIO2G7]|nr:hypothetical protein [Symploca sp. SIO2G7]